MTPLNDESQNGPEPARPELNMGTGGHGGPERNGDAGRAVGIGSKMPDGAVDDAFASLIAENFPDEVKKPARFSFTQVPVAPWVRPIHPAPPREASATTARQFGPRDWPASPEVEALEDSESHFAAPRPTKVLAAADPMRRLGAFGAAGGSLLALLALILRTAMGENWLTIGLLWLSVAAFLIGVGILVWKMPADKPSTHDGDGAVL